MEILQSAIYATQPLPLKNQIETLLRESSQYPVEDEILALIVPDSNLLSGGPQAADAFKTIAGKQYDTVIVVSPSHTGHFSRMTICSLKTYQTPLGAVEINEALCHELCDEDDDIFIDNQGHFHNKGIDVQLPYLQTVLSDFNIIPIVMGEESPEFCKELGTAIGEIMFNRSTLIVATVDILSSTEAALAQFKTLFESHNIHELMSILNSESVNLEGKGALLVAMIASLHRYGKRFQSINLTPPTSESPGFFCAYIGK